MDGKPDASGDIFSSDSVITFPEKVPVFLGTELVGRGIINKEMNLLKYEIDKSFKITDAMLNGKPCVAGFIAERDGRKIKKCTITSISLSLENADDRIKRIKDDE